MKILPSNQGISFFPFFCQFICFLSIGCFRIEFLRGSSRNCKSRSGRAHHFKSREEEFLSGPCHLVSMSSGSFQYVPAYSLPNFGYVYDAELGVSNDKTRQNSFNM